MHKLTWLAPFLFIFLVGCNEEPIERKKNEPESVNFVVVTTGLNSGIQSSMTSIYKLDTQKSFDEFWTQHSKDLQPPTAAPTIDFNKNMVVAVIDADQPSSGYQIAVERLQVVDDKLYIFAIRKQPGAGCVNLGMISQPFILIEVPKSDLIPELRLNTKTVDCQ